MFPHLKKILFLILITASLAACGNNGTGTPLISSVPPGATETPALPTATSEPLAVSVNGEGITLAEYNAELARYKAAQAARGLTVDDQAAAQAVLDELIAQVLLAQGAQEVGFVVDEAALQKRIADLAAQIGGAEALIKWQADHGYSEADFARALRRQIAAAWMRDQIAAQVPTSGEQVHAQQILTYSLETTQRAQTRLQSGEAFEDLAPLYDPNTRGDLGWFPRGYLFEKTVEDAAFNLQPGQMSEIITSGVGYHIIKVLARDPARPLSPDALLRLQAQAVQDWVKQRKDKSAIVFAP
jgi:peptidyl-prolyl cis-trans isomerase C